MTIEHQYTCMFLMESRFMIAPFETVLCLHPGRLEAERARCRPQYTHRQRPQQEGILSSFRVGTLTPARRCRASCDMASLSCRVACSVLDEQ